MKVQENYCKSKDYQSPASQSVKQSKKHDSTHGNRRQQSLWHVGHNDADEEDDGLQPGVAQDEGQDEEGHSEEDGHGRDDVNEMLDFDVDGCAADFELRCQGGDPTHHCPVTRGYDDAAGCAWEGELEGIIYICIVFFTISFFLSFHNCNLQYLYTVKLNLLGYDLKK